MKKTSSPQFVFAIKPFNPCGYAGGHRGATAPIHQTRIVVWSSPLFHSPPPPLFPPPTVIPPTETGLAQSEVDINNFFCALSLLYERRINTLRLLADKRSSHSRERSAELRYRHSAAASLRILASQTLLLPGAAGNAKLSSVLVPVELLPQ